MVQTNAEMRAGACVRASSRRKQKAEENVHNMFTDLICESECVSAVQVSGKFDARASFHFLNTTSSVYAEFGTFDPFQYS